MATVAFTRAEAAGGCYRYTWAGLTPGDVGVPVSAPGAADRSVHVFGTLGGASVVIEASNEDAASVSDYETLHDAQGTPLSLSSAGIYFVAENGNLVRPRISGGSGSSVTVILLARNTK